MFHALSQNMLQLFFLCLQEITGLKGEIALLRRALEDSKKRNNEMQAQQEGKPLLFIQTNFLQTNLHFSFLSDKAYIHATNTTTEPTHCRKIREVSEIPQ